MKATGWLLTVLGALALSIAAQESQQSNQDGPAAAIRALEHAWVGAVAQ